MEYYCLTDVGLIREKNQDSYIYCLNEYGDILMLVADGIGGSNAGEVASGEVIKYFNYAFKESGPFDELEDAKNYMIYHVYTANKHIYDLSNKFAEYKGMGTTITGIMICSKGNVVVNCGDSRVYGFKDNELIHLTQDHTLVNQMLDNGEITYEESINHPKKHYLVKAVGIFDDCRADVKIVDDMDYYLICSDGLHSYVSDEEIKKIVLDENIDVQRKVEDLKDTALLKGGYDNITVILAKR